MTVVRRKSQLGRFGAIRKSSQSTISDQTIIIGRETVAKPLRMGRRRRFVAEFPSKGYIGIGLSREEALGKLLLQTPTREYLGIVLEVS